MNLPACGGVGEPKVNQAYVWGIVGNRDNIWFGTVANTHCLVMGGYLGLTFPFENLSWVCEFGQGWGSWGLMLPSGFGDFRPPRIYVYNKTSDMLTDKTPLVMGAHQMRLNYTVGLRSAGSIGDLVILAGPSFMGGINLFAFNGSTGGFIDSTNLSAFSDIRKWAEVRNVLYTTVANSGGGCPGGSVLRWTGTVANPFQFDIVGNLDSMGAELTEFENRLFVGTWPNFGASCPLAGLYMSPIIPGPGLMTADAGGWTKVWQADDYEPDPVVAMTYAQGAMERLDGYLYWGTMHIPFLSAVYALDMLNLDANGNNQVDTDELLHTALGTYRAINIFRGKHFADNKKVDVLYGLRYLPVYDAGLRRYTIFPDDMHQNNMTNPIPRFGLPGFGNFFNVYTWSMQSYERQLYVGTFDWSYLLAQGVLGIVWDMSFSPPLPPEQAAILSGIYGLLDQVHFPWYVWGADLYRFKNRNVRAEPEDVAGIGNFTNYGIRNMFVEDGGMYLGMANPMNLLTKPSPNDPNDVMPEGGWELIQVLGKHGHHGHH